jgi:hypothetical protein
MNRKTEANENFLELNKETYNFVINLSEDFDEPEKLRSIADKESLIRKNEFHLTVIGSSTGKVISSYLDEHPKRENLIIDVDSLINSFRWDFSFTNKYYLIQKDYGDEVRSSLVQVVHVPSLEPFYQELNSMLHTELDVPFPHITLYSTSTNEENLSKGIGIYSESQFQELLPKLVEISQ